jgi:hypothetical protein
MQTRKKKLINPGLQLRLVAIFLCSAALAVQAEAILITYTLTKLAEEMPNDGSVLLSQLPEFVRTNLLLTFALLATLTLGVGSWRRSASPARCTGSSSSCRRSRTDGRSSRARSGRATSSTDSARS